MISKRKGLIKKDASMQIYIEFISIYIKKKSGLFRGGWTYVYLSVSRNLEKHDAMQRYLLEVERDDNKMH